MSNPPTAAQLAEMLGPVKDLLPVRLHGWSHPDDILGDTLICEATLTRWLLLRGYSLAMTDDFQLYTVECAVTGEVIAQGDTLLEALIAAVTAARGAK